MDAYLYISCWLIDFGGTIKGPEAHDAQQATQMHYIHISLNQDLI